MKHSELPMRIGLLVAPSDYPYTNSIIKGILEVTKGTNVCIISYMLGYDTLKQRFQNDILDFINNRTIDGLIISGSLSHDISEEVFKKFCHSFKPLPLVTLSVQVPGIHGIFSDNSVGMRQLMKHLLDDHHYERIAFIGGPVGQQEAEIRKSIFINEMHKRNLKVRDEWMVHGNFLLPSGIAAMEKLLEMGKPDFQGIVVANDEMAIAALNCLEDHGYKVPQDFFITGFDDFYSNILTTVRQSIAHQAKVGTTTILKILKGESVVKHTSIPSSVIIRSSCGCSPIDRLNQKARQLFSEEKFQKWLILLEDAFLESVKSSDSRLFLNHLQNLLDDYSTTFSGTLYLTILSELRKKVIPECIQSGWQIEAGLLLDQGSLLIIEYPSNLETQNTFDTLSKANQMRAFNESLANTVVMEEVLDIFFRDLPIMGFKSCFLSMFDNSRKSTSMSSLIFAYDESGRKEIPPEGILFPSQDLFPEEFQFTSNEDKFLIVDLLYSKKEILGFVVFFTDTAGGKISNAVSLLMSNAIQGVKLWEERKSAELLIIQSEKMAALGSLVAGVAHEINTPIGIGITAVSDIKVRINDINKLIKEGALSRTRFNKFMEILNEEFHLVETNLHRAGDLIRSFKKISVDQSQERSRLFFLGEYLQDIVSSLHPQLKQKKHSCEIICPEEIKLYGPPGTLAQIFSNLIGNSVLHGFENKVEGKIRILCSIRNGTVHIEYTDDGSGIEPEIISRIFEPFFTTKIGQGGSGLGLQIAYNQIVQIWKGTISCISVVGHGTKFLIDFPVPEIQINDLSDE
ncbi:MAG: substrate-binding domain-containing protein [Spirochaetaceae bacterium]|nr:substrate-binding domain-containing protein [Spirochaetaceae bacterium]